jgi:hypothetical protein
MASQRNYMIPTYASKLFAIWYSKMIKNIAPTTGAKHVDVFHQLLLVFSGF